MSVHPDTAALKHELLTLLRKKSVLFGDFTLASGAKSDFYVDCRVTTMDARGAWLIGHLGAEMMRTHAAEAESVGGLTMGADPVALSVAMASALATPESPVHAFAVRKQAKEHGRGRRIEGNFKDGAKVVVVDDVITTGGSTLQAIEAIRAEGGQIVAALVVVDRQEGGRAAIEAVGVPVYALCTKEELRAVQV